MTLDWNDLEGVSLDGRYWLKQCLSSTWEEACYLTRFGASCDAAVRVMRADAPGAPERLEVWRGLAVEHPHLLRLLDSGRANAAGADFIYAVSEYPDDLLARTLAERPLSGDEAGPVLEACLSALRFLHGKSLVHGAVAAESIGAVGETIKLPCDTIRRAGAPEAGGEDGEATAATPAADMWSLGVMLAEILTRERPAIRSEVGYLPEPFATIVSHTLRKDPAERWSAEEVDAYIHKPAVVAPLESPVTAAPLVRPAVAAEAETKEALMAADSQPAVRHGHSLRWVPLLGLVAAAGLSALFLPHVKEPAAGPSAAPMAMAPAKPATPSPAVAPPVAARPNPPVVAHNVETQSNPAAIWRVVVYEYSKRAAAERKAHSLNEKRPAWHAEVFAPRGERAPYFVALGGRMTLAEAERLKTQARGAGLPRDTFVRNFPR